MKETKILKLLGTFLVIGMLGLTSYCKQITGGDDDDNTGLVLGLAALAQQQAAEGEYQAQNNTTNPDFYCEATYTISSDTVKYLYPLLAAECNTGYLSWNQTKNRLIARIDSEFGGTTGPCQNTRSFIAGLPQPSNWIDPTSTQFKTGQSIAQYLANSYSLNASSLTVISPLKYKSYVEYKAIHSAANVVNESSCQTAVQNKINSEHPNNSNYCDLSGSGDTMLSFGLGLSLCNSTKTIVLDGICKVSGSATYPLCP